MFTFFYIFVYTYTCNDMRSVMLQINEYDDDDATAHCYGTQNPKISYYRSLEIQWMTSLNDEPML